MANENRYITVAYELFTEMDGKREMVEKAPEIHPFQFISGMGLTLDEFEAKIVPLAKGERFDFTLVPELAYGPRFEEAVQKLPRSVFEIDGKLNTDCIYEGAVVPLNNAEGERFNGTIVEITDESVTVDLNHPLAGYTLQFVGRVTENREATLQEIQEMANVLSGECDCGDCGGCGGDCGGCGGGCGKC